MNAERRSRTPQINFAETCLFPRCYFRLLLVFLREFERLLDVDRPLELELFLEPELPPEDTKLPTTPVTAFEIPSAALSRA